LNLKSANEEAEGVARKQYKSGDPNVKAMHRFVAQLFGNNATYITVKEAAEQGKRIYSIAADPVVAGK